MLLAMCLFGEARGESDRALRAVAQVVLNRARTAHRVFGSQADQNFEENLRRVILKPYQFSCFLPDDPNSAKLLRPLEHESAAVWRRCVETAEQALAQADEPDTLTLNADHYFDESLQTPSWADPTKQTVLIGRLRFYRLYLPKPTAGAAFLLRIGADDGSMPSAIAAEDAAANPSRRESSPPETSCRAGTALPGERRGDPARRHRREGSEAGLTRATRLPITRASGLPASGPTMVSTEPGALQPGGSETPFLWPFPRNCAMHRSHSRGGREGGGYATDNGADRRPGIQGLGVRDSGLGSQRVEVNAGGSRWLPSTGTALRPTAVRKESSNQWLAARFNRALTRYRADWVAREKPTEHKGVPD